MAHFFHTRENPKVLYNLDHAVTIEERELMNGTEVIIRMLTETVYIDNCTIEEIKDYLGWKINR